MDHASSPENEEFPLIPEELWYERLLRYGLYFGGVFQLVCFLAVIFLPPSGSWLKPEDNSDTSDDEEDTTEGPIGASTTGGPQLARTRKKPERKKKK